ncbi:MAG: hypothetical protein RLY14_793 [Planctomycetota bacterium]
MIIFPSQISAGNNCRPGRRTNRWIRRWMASSGVDERMGRR